MKFGQVLERGKQRLLLKFHISRGPKYSAELMSEWMNRPWRTHHF